MFLVLVCPSEGEGPRFGREGGSPGKASMEFPRPVRRGDGIGGLGSNIIVHVSSTLAMTGSPEVRQKQTVRTRNNLDGRNPLGNRGQYAGPLSFQTCEPK